MKRQNEIFKLVFTWVYLQVEVQVIENQGERGRDGQ